MIDAETVDLDFEFNEEEKGHECGIVGVCAEGVDVAALSYNALFALQHRGHDSAGVAVMATDGSIMCTKGLGTVEKGLREGDALKGLPAGSIASGQVRYSTNETISDESKFNAAQPLLGGIGRSSFALSHNGHLVNFSELRQGLPKPEDCYTDSQLMTCMIDREVKSGADLYEGIVSTTKQLN